MLAIIIPYYKLSFFSATLDSIASQSDKRFNVYIGDDASPEGCTAILEEYKGKFNFKYHYFETNLGGTSLTQQWERCIALSNNEEWLMVLGDDDVLDNNVVEEFYKLIEKNAFDISLIRFNHRVIDEYGELKSMDFQCKPYENTQDFLNKLLSMRETITASEFIFSREVYIKNNGFVDFPLAWFSDYATWLLFSKSNGIYQIQNASVYWRLSKINISSKSKDIFEIELKIRSLFLFMSFLQSFFNVEKQKQISFAQEHLSGLLSDVTFYNALGVLKKNLFKYKFKYAELIILRYCLKKVQRKIFKK